MSGSIWSTRSYCDISQTHYFSLLCHHWRSLYWCTNRVGYRFLPFPGSTDSIVAPIATDGLSRLYFGLHLHGVLEYAGPVLTWMRASNMPDWVMSPFLNIRSLLGAALMLSLVLYPYVYLLARAAFLQQSANLMEAGYTLGQSRLSVFRRIVIPMARPAIAAGALLAIMETVADFGTVQFFGVQTFTTGIIRTYYGFGDTPGAAQLSSVLLGFVAILVILGASLKKSN